MEGKRNRERELGLDMAKSRDRYRGCRQVDDRRRDRMSGRPYDSAVYWRGAGMSS